MWMTSVKPGWQISSPSVHFQSICRGQRPIPVPGHKAEVLTTGQRSRQFNLACPEPNTVGIEGKDTAGPV